MILDAGELVCDAQYYSCLEEEKYWYTLDENWFTKVRLRQVLKTNIDMMDNKTDNAARMTHHKLKTDDRRKGALKLVNMMWKRLFLKLIGGTKLKLMIPLQ